MIKSLYKFPIAALFLFVSWKSFAVDPIQKYSAPAMFTENKGQLMNTNNLPASEVKYYTQVSGINIYIGQNKIWYVFNHSSSSSSKSLDIKDEMPDENSKTESYRVELTLENASYNSELIAEESDGLVSNYFLPSCPNGITARNFHRIKMQNVYPGIDWILYFTEQNGKPIFKYDFNVLRGTDISQIKLQYNGAEKISKSDVGTIDISTPFGSIQDGQPYSFERESKSEIKSAFTFDNNTIGFETENSIATSDMVIDPTVLWSTYFGGNGDEHGRSVSVGEDGSVYIAGFTNSSNFPWFNGYSSPVHDAFDGWVMKCNPQLQPLWVIYYGGSLADVCRCVEADSAGNVFVAMETRSADMPVFNAYQPVKGDTDDFFILKLTPSGFPIWATFYGGNDLDATRRIDLSHHGYMVASGYSKSTNFPMINPIQATNAGEADAVFMKINMTTGYPIWTTYYGGTGFDEPVGITLDSNQNILVVGTTLSANFPVLNAYQSTLKGNSDIFVVKLNSNLTVAWSTYIGCTTDDDGNGIAIDAAGNVFIAGTTSKGNYPKLNAWQTTYKAPQDAVITKFSPTGTLKWSTLAGGPSNDIGQGIAVDYSGNVLVTGYTLSASFPVLNPSQATFAGVRDAFILRFNNNGKCLMATYYGGTGKEQARGIAVDFLGNCFVVGSTGSYDIPLVNPYQSANGGTGGSNGDCFIMKLNYAIIPRPSISASGNNPKCDVADVVQLTSSATQNNLWSTGATSISISTSDTGMYIVTAADTTGITISSFPYHIYESPLISVVVDSLTIHNACEYSNLALVPPAISNATFTWSGPNGFYTNTLSASVPNVTSASLGLYLCTAYTNNCSKVVRKVLLNSIMSVQAPGSTSCSAPVCQGGQISFQTDSVVGVGYSWHGPNGFSSTNRTFTRTNMQPADEGNYNLHLTQSGCESLPATVFAEVYTQPVSNAGQDLNVCGGTSTIVLDAVAPTEGIGTWTCNTSSPPTIVNTHDPHTLITNITSASNTLKWTVTNGTCTSNYDNMIVKSTPLANFGCVKPSNLYATVVGTSATLNWSACTTGENFQIIYSLNGINYNLYTTAYSYVLNSLAPGNYTWKVRPKCSGAWSAYWSYIASFTVVDSPKLDGSLNDAPQLLLYPNPSDQNLNAEFEINVAGIYRFDIINLLGQSVISFEKYFDEGRWTESSEISNLAAGLYYFRVKGENGSILKSKFIKE